MVLNEEEFPSIKSISPIDGRYRKMSADLDQFFSEFALHRERVYIELQYLLSLSRIEAIDIELEQKKIKPIYENFTVDDARVITKIEKEGYEGIPATHHDIKAVEYFLKRELTSMGYEDECKFVHFGLTSEDVNNIAYSRLIRRSSGEVIIPCLVSVLKSLVSLVKNNKNLAMLSRTHGQPASPTTLGKEFAVFAIRLVEQIEQFESASNALKGKIAGASGNWNAHYATFPEVDWLEFSRKFVREMGLTPNLWVTQIEPRDTLSRLFRSLTGINDVLIDLSTDCWLYTSIGYLSQKKHEGEVGSSTMPHKLNPIQFENSEGNLNKANSDLSFIAGYVTKSRYQRDLSDSTVMRNIGVSFAHSLIGYKNIHKGLEKIQSAPESIKADLEKNAEVLTEAWQLLLKKAGYEDSYETIKDVVRGKTLSSANLEKIVAQLPIKGEHRDSLSKLRPGDYTGRAGKLAQLAVDKIEEFIESWDKA